MYDASIPVSSNGVFGTSNNNNYQNNNTVQSTTSVDINNTGINDNVVTHSFCGNCGTKLDNSVKFCPNCGKEIK